MNITLNTDAPTDPDYTRDVADALSEAVRVLNHHTAKAGALHAPSDVYDVLGRLSAGTAGMRQLFHQLSVWVAAEHEAGRVRADHGDTEERVRATRSALAEAAGVAEALGEVLRSAHNTTSTLARST